MRIELSLSLGASAAPGICFEGQTASSTGGVFSSSQSVNRRKIAGHEKTCTYAILRAHASGELMQT